MKITNSSKLAEEEEKITKKKALELFDKKIIENFEIGTFKGLREIHKYLFQDIYYFAGKIRYENKWLFTCNGKKSNKRYRN